MVKAEFDDDFVEKAKDVYQMEQKLKAKNDPPVCRKSGLPEKCGEGSLGAKCAICNRTGKM
jgi:hypothetical protein